ncbi:hypothetical protein BH11PSE2_BH11PSE2_14770 [soil metagenome]
MRKILSVIVVAGALTAGPSLAAPPDLFKTFAEVCLSGGLAPPTSSSGSGPWAI